MPVSTSTISVLLPLSVSMRVHMCACMCDKFLYSRTYELSFLCRIIPFEEAQRRRKSGGRHVRVREQAKEKCGVKQISQCERQPKGHSLSVHPQTLSKTFHFLLRRRVTTIACLSSWDQRWGTQ